MAWRGRDPRGGFDNNGGSVSPKALSPRSKWSQWQMFHACATAVLALLCIYLLAGRSAEAATGADLPAQAELHAASNLARPAGTEGAAAKRVGILEGRIKRKDDELEALRRELRHAEKALAAKASAPAANEADGENEKRLATLEKRDKAMARQVVRATEAVASLSAELLKRKFGAREPYRARITVGFPASMGAPSEGSILIEMAPSSLMPTGVLYFMSQVEAGLWNGCSFIRNAGHVLQASPQTPRRKAVHQRFNGLPHQGASIPFQEYHENFPHKKYTLGLAGRPGGPDFYISTVDNTRNHGPGGQGSYDLPAEADSCFAKVVEGFDVVDRMHTAPHHHDSFEGLVEFIEIKSIDLVLGERA